MIHSKHRFHGEVRYGLCTKKGAPCVPTRPWRCACAKPAPAELAACRGGQPQSEQAAVVRNRIRRRIFEIVRHEGGRIAPQYDLVFSVYGAELATIGHEELRVRCWPSSKKPAS